MRQHFTLRVVLSDVLLEAPLVLLDIDSLGPSTSWVRIPPRDQDVEFIACLSDVIPTVKTTYLKRRTNQQSSFPDCGLFTVRYGFAIMESIGSGVDVGIEGFLQ